MKNKIVFSLFLGMLIGSCAFGMEKNRKKCKVDGKASKAVSLEDIDNRDIFTDHILMYLYSPEYPRRILELRIVCKFLKDIVDFFFANCRPVTVTYKMLMKDGLITPKGAFAAAKKYLIQFGPHSWDKCKAYGGDLERFLHIFKDNLYGMHVSGYNNVGDNVFDELTLDNFRTLKDCKRLRKLSFRSFSQFSDDVFQYLPDKLQDLCVSCVAVTSGMYPQLKKLTNLKRLCLVGIAPTANDLEQLPCQALEEIQVTIITLTGEIPEALQRFKRLKSVTLRKGLASYDCSTKNIGVEELPKTLKKLHINFTICDEGLEIICERLPQLEELNIGDPRSVLTEDGIAHLDRLKNLEKLSFYTKVPDQFNLGQLPESLRELELKRGYGEGIKYYDLQRMPKHLKKLILGHNTWIYAQHLEYIESLPQLETLSLRCIGNEAFCDTHVEAIAEKFPKLQRLEIIDHRSSSLVADALRYLPENIRSLYLGSPEILTEEVAHALPTTLHSVEVPWIYRTCQHENGETTCERLEVSRDIQEILEDKGIEFIAVNYH